MAYYSNPRFVHSLNQGGPLVRSYQEANSQSFKAGELVYLTASGEALTACADDAVVVLGIALADANNTTTENAQIPVCVLRVGDEVEIDVYQGSSVDAATEAMLGQNFAYEVTSNEGKIDLNDTGHDLMTLQKIVNADATTVLVTFIPTTLQYHVGF